ncbi:MAG: hypothetical protein LBS91_08405 [Clostridiales Family XIII bacterium]|jgi:epoxyqueuosine reductase QueG|nr:hypothetical protein [Clostridiales Family XIII bacterium]
MTNETAKIKKFILEDLDMDLAGVCDAGLLEDEPEGHRPSDILPGARSAIVYAYRVPDGGTQAAFRYFEDGSLPARAIYSAYSADLAPNAAMLFRTFDLAQHIERSYGYVACPLPSGPMQAGVPLSVPVPAFAAPFKVGLPFNIERAAFAAGLGDYGWSGRLLTEEYGPRVHFGAVITSMPLEFDAPRGGAPICGGESCLICVGRCPVNAIPGPDTGQSRTLGAGGVLRKAADVRLNRCIVAACALRKEYGGIEDYIDSVEHEEPTDASLAEAFAKKPVNHWEGLDHYPKWKCDKCLIYCPAGKWKERFADRNLAAD